MKRSPLQLTLVLALILLSASTVTRSEDRPTEIGTSQKETNTVRIQLKWFHQFQFAGLYAAVQQGYFKEEGLRAVLLEGGPTIDPAKVVANAQAEFGIGNSSLVINRSQGLPLIALASIFQRSPFVILARREDSLRSIRDLEGQKVMGEQHAAELTAYLRLAGVNEHMIHWVPHSGSVRSLLPDNPLNVIATTAYTSSEPYAAIQAQLPYRVFNPRELNIDFYGDTLFTSEAEVKSNPERVAAVRRAVLKGWQYAHQNQEEIIQLILQQYPTQKDYLQLAYEAEVIDDLLASDVVEIGYMSPTRWQHIVEVFQQADLLPSGFSITGFLYNDQPSIAVPAWLYTGLAALLCLVAVVSYVAWRFYSLSESRQQEIEKRLLLEQTLKNLAMTDPLSGLANRRHLQEQGDYEIERARRHQQPLSILLFDLDEFKTINDRYGHSAGDECIQTFAHTCQLCLRSIDLAARSGGDEFVVLLPGTTIEEATQIGLRICYDFRQSIKNNHSRPNIDASASVGVATLTDGDTDLDTIMRRADSQMYLHKQTQKCR